MQTLTPRRLAAVIKRCYAAKVPLYIHGAPGIGKSAICRQVAEQIAKEKGKTFHDWTALDLPARMELLANPSGHFVFCDQRISQMDATDLRGLPRLHGGEFLETQPMSWVIYFTRPGADGVIFFDEINLAAPMVAGSAYQIIHDRAISDRRLADEVFLIAAGNRDEDQAFTFELPFPLRDRFAEVELKHHLDEWFQWAGQNRIHPHIMAFLQWREKCLFDPATGSKEKGATPRGWERASKLLGELEDTTGTEANLYITASVGGAAATEFTAYLKNFKSLDWKVLFEKPESVKDLPLDVCYALVGGLSDLLAQWTPEKPYTLGQLVDLVDALPPEMGLLGIRMLYSGAPARFMEMAVVEPRIRALAARIRRYILE